MNAIASAIVRTAKKSAFKIKKHAPEILLGVGVLTSAGATVLACKATLKAQPTLDKAKNELDEIHTADNDPRVSYAEYPKEQVKKDITRVYFNTAKELSKTYLPTVALWSISMACMVGSHAMTKRQLSALMAAYTALGNSFREYRRRIEENLADENAAALGYADKTEDGHFIQVEDKPSYVFIFDKNNPYWKDNIEYNLVFLKGAQRLLDYHLKRDHFVFVNDVLKELGFECISSGQLDGWIYDPDHPKAYNDGYISFGLYNRDGSETEALTAYKAGKIDYLPIKLNIDGTIYDRI